MNSKFVSGAKQRCIQVAVAILIGTTVAACGGGSGNEVVENAGAPLFTSAGVKITVAAGSTSEFNVGGGGGGAKFTSYSASSADPKIAVASLDGTKLTIKGLASGKTTISVGDTAGAIVTIEVTVPEPPVDLNATAPISKAIEVGAAPAYTIQGGIAPYTTSTSDAGIATATVTNGNQLNITGRGPGVANIVVSDSTGKSVSVAVSVSGGTGDVALYTTAPDSITISAGAAATYKIGGGAGPYSVTSSDVSVVTVNQDGNNFTATGIKAGFATIAVRDANGSPVNISVTVP